MATKSEICKFLYKPLTLLEIYPHLEAVSNIKEMQSSQPVTFSVSSEKCVRIEVCKNRLV